MIFSNAFIRPLVLSKIGDLLSGGWTRTIDAPPTPRTIEVPKTGGAPETKPGVGGEQLDQHFIDSKAGGFEGTGHVSGTRQPGGAADANAHESPGLAKYKEEQHKNWQAKKDMETRDKLFGQPTSGRVDGKEVEPFSSKSLSEGAESLVNAEKTKVKKADPARNSSLVRTAAIALPFSALGLIAAGTVNAFLKTVIDPSSTAAGVTEEDVKNSRIVDQTQKDVFIAANTLNDLRGDAHVAPDLKWAMKTDEQRMDTLEDMLDYVEEQVGVEAKKLGVQFSLPSTGALEDDTENRASAINSRLALISGLFSAMASKLKADTE